MLDFGWAELFVIIAVTVLVIGPDEIPKVMVGLGRLVRRFQYVKFALSRQFEDLMRDADLEDLRKQVNFEERPEHAEHFDEAEADEDEAYLAEEHSSIQPDKKDGVND